ncbi:MAG: outer membrane lipid asymmetry maintenance protein MlaD [Syntrophales bacterium]|jgi:phospholipid/cholesterol/gamma-HCH transport system substrate-binding protein|nr:outer membrane lipid asymmetry maintenance protein MlaD [Syntrophales bacterium]MCU0583446.1 outer membrane lipid asymmetry maintenance protein MlaD [Syntrophales bacterium]
MKKYVMETAVGIFVAIGLLCVGYLTLKLGNIGILEGDQYRVLAKFSSVSGLRAGSTVQMYGIEVGRVERLGMDSEAQQAQVEMLIRKDVKIYEDALAAIKTEGLIGDKYVSIDPGGLGDPLKPGDSIIQTQAAVDVGDLISKYAFGDVKKEEPEKK